jgi:hypothetical protein
LGFGLGVLYGVGLWVNVTATPLYDLMTWVLDWVDGLVYYCYVYIGCSIDNTTFHEDKYSSLTNGPTGAIKTPRNTGIQSR